VTWLTAYCLRPRLFLALFGAGVLLMTLSRNDSRYCIAMATTKPPKHVSRSPIQGYSQYFDNGTPARPLPYSRLYPVYQKLSKAAIADMLTQRTRLLAMRQRLAKAERLEPVDMHRPEDLQLLAAITARLTLQTNQLNNQLKPITDPMGAGAMGVIQQLSSWQQMTEAVTQLQYAVDYWREHDDTYRQYGLSNWQLTQGHADVLALLDKALLELDQLAQWVRIRNTLRVQDPP
jgi:hypothetical protein